MTFKATITVLTLATNNISALSANEAKLYSNVTHLDLSNNRIRSWQNIKGISKFKKLTILDLSGNHLVTMDFQAFLSRNTNLQEIDASNNINMSINEKPARLKELRRLYLINNQMLFLPIGAFTEFSSLELLDLTNNALTGLPAELNKILPRLSHIFLSGNSIIELDICILQISDLEDLKDKTNSTQKCDEDATTPHSIKHVDKTTYTDSSQNKTVIKQTTIRPNGSNDNYVANLSNMGNETLTPNNTQESNTNTPVLAIVLGVTIPLALLIVGVLGYLRLKRSSSSRFSNQIEFQQIVQEKSEPESMPLSSSSEHTSSN